MISKIKITFGVPDDLQKELRARIVKDGYGLRGKSRWVSEAVEQLLKIENFPELVNYNDEMYGFEKAETVTIEPGLKVKLDYAIVKVREKFLTLEGVQSCIVRTAILQRLLRF